MSAAELLPCPFCGGKADWHNIGNEHTKSRSTKIWCSECRVTRNTGAIRHSLDWTKEHAFAAWNSRHTPSSPVSAPSPAGGVREALETAERLNASAKRGKVDGRVFVDYRDWEAFMAEVRAALSSPATPEPVSAPANGEVHEPHCALWGDEPADCDCALSNPAPGHGEAVPYCWVIPGDDTANADGWIDARVSSEGEFTKPLYAHPTIGEKEGRA